MVTTADRGAHIILLLAILLTPIADPLTASAQSTFGTFTGTVTDTTGAVVQGASVLITNKRTLIQRTVTSDGDGNYTAANLDPAIYHLSVDAPGFRKQTTGDIELLARQIARFDF